jgi:large subunit ribosomal protein L10
VALNIIDKKAIVAELAALLTTSTALVGVCYTGTGVENMTRLRQSARSVGVVIRVARNTLVKRAVENTNFSCVKDHFVGHIMLAFSQEEPGSAARVIRDFIKENNNCVVKIIAVGGEALPVEKLEAVAKLPTRLEAIAKLMGVMKAPVGKLAATMMAVPLKTVRTVVAIKDQKESI